MINHFIIDVLRLSIWLVLLVAIFVPLEWLCGVRPAKIWRKEIGIDLAWYFINSLAPAAILSVPLALIARTLHGIDPGGLYSTVAAWPIWLKLLVALIVNDLGAYWAHRAMHTWPALWRFHAIHHSPEHLDWLVNTRVHPFDMVFTRFCGLTPVYLLGLAQSNGSNEIAAIVTIFGTFWTFFIHSNVRVRLGPLEWVISSPAFHHWHHTNDEHRDRNFAAIFPIIDRLFGTVWLPKHWPPVYGTDARVPSTLAGQFFGPMEPQAPQGAAPSAKAAESQTETPSPESPTGSAADHV